MNVINVNSKDANYGGGFYWYGGGAQVTSGQGDLVPVVFSSPYIGFDLVCGQATCGTGAAAYFDVYQLTLSARETDLPTFIASGLWSATGWVRGVWPLASGANSPSGVCHLKATLGGLQVGEETSPQDVSTWHQCAAPGIETVVDTAQGAQGAQVPLILTASDAAGETGSDSANINIDNQQPTVYLSGPTDTPSTAGTQYVTVTAAAGPSGIAGISCSVDNGPEQWYPANTARVPVSGVGEHVVWCSSENNAVDSNGVHGTSQTQGVTMKIGTPTIAGIAFSAVADKLRCRKVTERVRIPARWVKGRSDGKVVRVREPAHTVTIRVTRCHPQTVTKRVTRTVSVRRNGKTIRVRRRETVRVVREPHTVYKTSKRVGFGRATTVQGWLGTNAGVALGGQPVQVLTAADNGRNDYRVAATATTAANGSWSARLPAGPSRLVTVAYSGSATTEATFAAAVHVVVPARVQLVKVSPRRVPWGGEVHLTGRLEGGYLPPGGALVRLRIGEGSAVTTYGVREHVRGNGRFTTTYRFGEGEASAHRTYWFQIASLPMGDYPYAPAASQRRYVRVGGHL